MRSSTSSKPSRKKSKAVPIRPLSRQKILSSSSSTTGLGPVTPPATVRRVIKAYSMNPEGSHSIRPETAPGGSLDRNSKRPASRAHGPGGQGTTFLTGFGIEDDSMSVLTERDPDDESVATLSTHGFKLTPLEASKYFGERARSKFFRHCNYMNKQRSLTSLPSMNLPSVCFKEESSAAAMGPMSDPLLDDDEFDQMTLPTASEAMEEEVGLPTSPRSNYIFDCLADRLNPRASLIIRKKAITSLNLKHLGMGDKMAGHLAKAIKEIPCLESVDISDNGLSDEGLKPMLAAILSIPTLTELNVSQNEIGGEAAEALALYVENPNCPLQRLIMQRADVDDFEGERFVTGLLNNQCLTELDLAHNKLGTAETLNTVMPDLTTAPEALATLLRSPNCKLKVLKVPWNMIRLDSAVDLASSIAINNTVTYLDISYNSLGSDGGKTLGDALIDNRSISELHIGNNNITAVACFTICIGIQENLALTHVSMDGNPIGEAGAKSLMQIPTATGNRVTVTARGCNTQLRDDKCWFDQKYPCRQYELDLSDPFERSISFQVLRIAANHQTLILKDVTYQEPPASKTSRPPPPEKLELEQIVTNEKINHFPEKQRILYENLKLLKGASSDIKEAKLLFQQADADQSGEIDKPELMGLLPELGIFISENQVDDVMSRYDVDGTGTIELPEFLGFVKSLHEDADKRMRDMSETIQMALTENLMRRYVPPREGILRMELLDGFLRKDLFQVLSNADQSNMTSVAKATGDASSLLPFGFENMKIRLNEALDLYETMFKDSGDKIKILVKLLPQMASSEEVRALIKKITNNDVLEVQRVKQALGQALKPIWGMPNGYYNLDLTKDMDRICLSMLFEHSHTLNSKRGGLCRLDGFYFGDTSQHQNWQCFRNEIYNGNPLKLTPQLFTPMPRTGRLSFDFSGGFRSVEIPPTITDSKMMKILLNSHVIDPMEKMQYEHCLASWGSDKPLVKNSNSGLGKTIFEISIPDALEIGEWCHKFYTNVPKRMSITIECARREEIKVNIREGEGTPRGHGISREDRDDDDDVFGAPSPNRSQSELVARSGSALERETPTAPMISSVDENEESIAAVSKERSFSDLFAPGSNISGQEGAQFQAPPKRESVSESRDKFRRMLSTHGISDYAKSDRLVNFFEDVLGTYWIKCRHLAIIIKAFTIGKIEKSTYFGTYRSELICNMFPRVVDIHNMDLVMQYLTPFEIASLYCRIGRLNLFNPMKPEGAAELHLGTYEDRQVAKMIMVLSAVEPGDNWKDARLRWDREQSWIPGWEVTVPWMQEEGVQKKGYFFYSYYCGKGQNLDGCRADVNWRKALFKLCLIRESDVTYDLDPEAEEDVIRNREKTVRQFMEERRERFCYYLRFRPEAEIQAFELST